MNLENDFNTNDSLNEINTLTVKESTINNNDDIFIPKKQKLLSQLEHRLLSTKKYRQSWLIILGMTFVIFALSAVVLVYQFYPHTGSLKENMILNHKFALASQVIVYISYGLMFAPFLYLIGTWISNVNNVSRSKYLHLCFWIIYSVCITLMLIAIILSFRSGMLPS